jgi:hypothetical protein
MTRMFYQGIIIMLFIAVHYDWILTMWYRDLVVHTILAYLKILADAPELCVYQHLVYQLVISALQLDNL